MADIINEIISEKAIQDVEKLKNELALLIKTFEESSDAATALMRALRSSGDPAPQLEDYKKKLSETEKITAKLVQTQQQLEASQTAHAQLLANERQALLERNRQLREAAKEQTAAKGSYVQLDAELKKLTAQYKALGQAEREASKGQTMLRHLQALEVELKSLDATMGKHNRNVGNYRNETFQLSQVIREVPAFTYSASTGIMALSNNLPMLFDGFSKVAKETGSATKALGIFAKSIFSLPNLFAIAVGLFTIFSKEIIEWFEKITTATSEQIRYQKALNEAYADDSVKNAIQNVKELSEEIELAKNGFLDKQKVVKHYNETIGKTTGLVKSIEEAERALAKNADAYIKMTLYKAAANKLLEKSADDLIEKEKIAQGDPRDVLSGWEKFLALTKEAFTTIPGFGKGSYQGVISDYMLGKEGDLEKRIKDSDKLIDSFMKKAAELAKQMGFNYFDDNAFDKPKKPKKGKKIDTRTDDEFIADNWYKMLELEEQVNQYRIKMADEESKRVLASFLQKKEANEKATELSLAQLDSEYAKGGIKTEEYEKKKQDIKLKYLLENLKLELKYAQDSLADGQLIGDERIKLEEMYHKIRINISKTEAEIAKNAQEEQVKSVKEAYKKEQEILAKRLKDIETLKQIINEYFSSAKEIGEVIFQRQMMRLDEETRKIQDKYKIEEELIKANFTTIEERDKALARLNIQKLAEEENIRKQRLRQQQRQARFQKTLDAGEIISKTAIAVISALNPPPIGLGPVAGVGPAIAAGITGAIQLAKVLATPIPQYAKGTESHTGGLAIVGEKGKEIVIEPGGKAYFTPSTDTLMDLPKNTKVIPNHKIDSYLYKNPNVNQFMSSATSNMILNFEETNSKLDQLINVTKRKSMSVNLYGDAGFYTYQKRNVR